MAVTAVSWPSALPECPVRAIGSSPATARTAARPVLRGPVAAAATVVAAAARTTVTSRDRPSSKPVRNPPSSAPKAGSAGGVPDTLA